MKIYVNIICARNYSVVTYCGYCSGNISLCLNYFSRITCQIASSIFLNILLSLKRHWNDTFLISCRALPWANCFIRMNICSHAATQKYRVTNNEIRRGGYTIKCVGTSYWAEPRGIESLCLAFIEWPNCCYQWLRWIKMT